MSNKEYNKFVIKKLDKIKQVKPIAVSVEELQVTIQMLQHRKCTYISPHTGKEHYWAGAGSLVTVPQKDADFLLETTVEVGGCCGSKPQYIKVFKEVK